MCLDFLNPLEETSGYAVKFVRRTKKADEFTPHYPYFDVDGGGGRGTPITWTRSKRAQLVKAALVWKIGRTYRVKHNRLARTDGVDKTRYPALVHCYKDLKSGRFDNCPPDGQRVPILVKYSGGQYCDGRSLTAKYVTPVAVLDGNVYKKFIQLEKEKGFKTAAEILVLAQYFLEG